MAALKKLNPHVEYVLPEIAKLLKLDDHDTFALIVHHDQEGRYTQIKIPYYGELSVNKLRIPKDELVAYLFSELFYTPMELAKILDVPISNVYLLLEEKKIPSFKAEKTQQVLIKKDDVVRYMAKYIKNPEEKIQQ